MVPLRLDLQPPSPTRQPLAFTAGQTEFLNNLRFVALSCRAKPKTNLFTACALLQATPSASKTAYAEALLRCLSEALGKSAKLFAPGTAEMSFDESWLMQLAIACQNGDDVSLSFLLRSRVRHEHRRLMAFLVDKTSEYFPLD